MDVSNPIVYHPPHRLIQRTANGIYYEGYGNTLYIDTIGKLMSEKILDIVLINSLQILITDINPTNRRHTIMTNVLAHCHYYITHGGEDPYLRRFIVAVVKQAAQSLRREHLIPSVWPDYDLALMRIINFLTCLNFGLDEDDEFTEHEIYINCLLNFDSFANYCRVVDEMDMTSICDA